MAKKITGYVKLQIPAGVANPSPPIGPALGQHGVNIMEFCKQFNARTQGMDPTDIIPVFITIHQDKSFTFVLRSVPAAILLKKAAGLKKGSSAPNKNKVGKVTKQQLIAIAQQKMADLTGNDLEAMVRTIEGTAHSMGIEIIDNHAE